MRAIKTDAASGRLAELEVAKLLWEEYKYRHDLIWRLLFRMTTVATLLSVVPISIGEDARERAGEWLHALPAIGFVVVLVSYAFLIFEFRLFEPINDTYVRAQDRAVGEPVRKPPSRDWFKRIIYGYPPVLAGLVLVAASSPGDVRRGLLTAREWPGVSAWRRRLHS